MSRCERKLNHTALRELNLYVFGFFDARHLAVSGVNVYCSRPSVARVLKLGAWYFLFVSLSHCYGRTRETVWMVCVLKFTRINGWSDLLNWQFEIYRKQLSCCSCQIRENCDAKIRYLNATAFFWSSDVQINYWEIASRVFQLFFGTRGGQWVLILIIYFSTSLLGSK